MLPAHSSQLTAQAPSSQLGAPGSQLYCAVTRALGAQGFLFRPGGIFISRAKKKSGRRGSWPNPRKKNPGAARPGWLGEKKSGRRGCWPDPRKKNPGAARPGRPGEKNPGAAHPADRASLLGRGQGKSLCHRPIPAAGWRKKNPAAGQTWHSQPKKIRAPPLPSWPSEKNPGAALPG